MYTLNPIHKFAPSNPVFNSLFLEKTKHHQLAEESLMKKRNKITKGNETQLGEHRLRKENF